MGVWGTVKMTIDRREVVTLLMIYLSYKLCVPNKTEDLNVNVFNMIAVLNELETLTKHILCKCKCIFHGKNVTEM